jgi:hypothetical protein
VLAAVAVLIATIVVMSMTWLGGRRSGEWSLSQLVRESKAGHVRQLDIDGTDGTAIDKSSGRWMVRLPQDSALVADRLITDGVDVRYMSGGAGSVLAFLLPNLIVLLLVAGLAGSLVMGARRLRR